MTEELKRCFWANPDNPLYLAYHDEEWGEPFHDDRMLFEMLILEGFQAGLSWECVLNKREAFREAFDNFDVHKVVKYDVNKLASLADNPKIIRNKLKINASIKNAKAFIKIQEEFGSFYNYIWGFTDREVITDARSKSRVKLAWAMPCKKEEYYMSTCHPLSVTRKFNKVEKV